MAIDFEEGTVLRQEGKVKSGFFWKQLRQLIVWLNRVGHKYMRLSATEVLWEHQQVVCWETSPAQRGEHWGKKTWLGVLLKSLISPVTDPLTTQHTKPEEVWSRQSSCKWIQLVPKVVNNREALERVMVMRWQREDSEKGLFFFLQKFDGRGLGRRKIKICSVIAGFWHEDGEQAWKRM